MIQHEGIIQSMEKRMIPYNHKLAPLYIRDSLFSLIPNGTEHIYIIGIGSSKINGDSLGPFVGTLLNRLYPGHLTVLGNLQLPWDAERLSNEYTKLSIRENSFVVAIDSVLGTEQLVNSIVIRQGALQPGIGLGNYLPPIGHCSIMGVVQENKPGKESALFYTDLHMIYSMAANIAKGISLSIRQYFKYPSEHPILFIS